MWPSLHLFSKITVLKDPFAMGKDKMQILSSRVNAGEIYCGLRLQKKLLNLIHFMFHLSVVMRVYMCQHCNGIIKKYLSTCKILSSKFSVMKTKKRKASI